MYSAGGSPTFIDVTFARNNVGSSVSFGAGGGLFVRDGAPILQNVTFEENDAFSRGGGLGTGGDSRPTLRSVSFVNNDAGLSGGGMFNEGRATLVDVTFRGNTAVPEGGGMFNEGTQRSLLINVDFRGNTAGAGGNGGGLHVSESSMLIFVNSLFYDNDVQYSDSDDPGLGGAVYVTDGAAARFVNATFASNRAAGSGGALFVADSSEAVVRNSILWKNRADGSADQIATDSLPASVADVDTSLVEGGYDGSASARPDFIVDADPQFEDRSGGDLRVLTDGAPVLDRGARRYLPPDSLDLDADGDTTEKLPLDLAGAERFIDNNEDADPEVDLGAYEAPAGVTPVELAAFTAARLGDEPAAALLRWRTVSETSNDGFVIEHRSAASDSTWQRAGFVEGAGTTQDPQRYRFRVSDLAPGTHAFRLRQRDLDGATQRHRPVEVHIGMSERFVLEAPYPNPARGTGAAATVAFGSRRGEPVRLLLYDALGRQVRTLWRGTPAAGRLKRVRIDAAGLSSGTYFLRLVGAEGGAAKTQSLTLVR
jgi:predicted outer membrane repeat protein